MILLVCGGRDYWDHERVTQELDRIAALNTIDVLLQGGANGADALARAWADSRGGIQVVTYHYVRGLENPRSGGPMRNAWMLSHGKPDLVLAFPGGNGTADVVAKAKAAGAIVQEIPR